MRYTAEQLGMAIRRALKANPGQEGKWTACALLASALDDPAFLDAYVTRDQCRPRRVLYEDGELGFCICGHVYEGDADGLPHDHGATWAIYGVAEGQAEMTEWRVISQGQNGAPSLVERARTYVMRPGDCRFYDVGDIHSPKRQGLLKLIRIEGRNLDRVKRSNIKAA